MTARRIPASTDRPITQMTMMAWAVRVMVFTISPRSGCHSPSSEDRVTGPTRPSTFSPRRFWYFLTARPVW